MSMLCLFYANLCHYHRQTNISRYSSESHKIHFWKRKLLIGYLRISSIDKLGVSSSKAKYWRLRNMLEKKREKDSAGSGSTQACFVRVLFSQHNRMFSSGSWNRWSMKWSGWISAWSVALLFKSTLVNEAEISSTDLVLLTGRDG